jgi:DNA ligase 1
MKQFAQLFDRMDATNGTNAKVAEMESYFRSAPAADCAWAAFFLCGGKLRAPLPMRSFRAWTIEAAEVPDWLFDECHDAVGDFAETASLLLPDPEESIEDNGTLAEWIETRLAPMRDLLEVEKKTLLLDAWSRLTARERFVWNKLITGAFRVGVSKALVIRAISRASEVPEAVVAHRFMGIWSPTASAWEELRDKDRIDTIASQPYPFCLAYPLQADPATLGSVSDWLAEWKWDGIRAQVIRRQGATYVWSRGNELITERFPEIELVASRLPEGTVIDGELAGWSDGKVLPFADLQTRIGRKVLSKAILSRVPVTILAFDLLEWKGQDIRARPLHERRNLLESLGLSLSPGIVASSWLELGERRATARELGAEGLMLKRLNSAYGIGREKGNWWKWKIEPYSIDAVLIYAQRGHGKRAGLYTDYTFGVWNGSELVPFAKAYSGLTDEEIREVDRFIRQNTLERFGPVSTVRPELVFEIAFEAIQRSSRHKSGVAVRFPRMSRWRTDKKPEDADTIDTVLALLPSMTSPTGPLV